MKDLESDLIRNDALDAFEAEVFQKTVSTARRTRRNRIIARVVIATAICVAAFQIPFKRQGIDPHLALQEPSAQTTPARRLQLVRSTPFAGTIHTKALSSEHSLTTKNGLIAVVRTSASVQPEITRINDEELLSLFQGKPVAIIGRGANAELIFPETAPTN